MPIMKRYPFSKFFIAGALFFSSAVFANHVTLSGLFDGTEPTLMPFNGTCGGDDMLGYLEIGPIQVSSTGIYDIADAGDGVAVDVVIRIYDGTFDPQNVQVNIVGASIDIAEQIQLEANKQYVVVIQHWCFNQTGTYGVAFSGPGNITGIDVVVSPDYWLGQFALGDPMADFGFGNSNFDISGPIQFDKSGTYFFADLGWFLRTDLVLLVYEGAFNPSDPGQNMIAELDDAGFLQLETGKDYYFVTYPLYDNATGEWHFALFPPGKKTPINLFLDGAWNNPNTRGQGVLIDVLPTAIEGTPFMFLAWFTFDEQPVTQKSDSGSGKVLSVGDSSQRWLTAFGTYAEGMSEVALSFENTSGGVFNSEIPTPTQDSAYGTGTLIVEDCENLTLEFNIPSGPGQGSTHLERSATDPLKLSLCEVLSFRPGVIK
jgi:hypothetical protein